MKTFPRITAIYVPYIHPKNLHVTAADKTTSMKLGSAKNFRQLQVGYTESLPRQHRRTNTNRKHNQSLADLGVRKVDIGQGRQAFHAGDNSNKKKMKRIWHVEYRNALNDKTWRLNCSRGGSPCVLGS